MPATVRTRPPRIGPTSRQRSACSCDSSKGCALRLTAKASRKEPRQFIPSILEDDFDRKLQLPAGIIHGRGNSAECTGAGRGRWCGKNRVVEYFECFCAKLQIGFLSEFLYRELLDQRRIPTILEGCPEESSRHRTLQPSRCPRSDRIYLAPRRFVR